MLGRTIASTFDYEDLVCGGLWASLFSHHKALVGSIGSHGASGIIMLSERSYLPMKHMYSSFRQGFLIHRLQDNLNSNFTQDAQMMSPQPTESPTYYIISREQDEILRKLPKVARRASAAGKP